MAESDQESEEDGEERMHKEVGEGDKGGYRVDDDFSQEVGQRGRAHVDCLEEKEKGGWK